MKTIESVVPKHNDGTIVMEEEALQYINQLPLNESGKKLIPIQLNCTIEEYAKRTGAMFMEDFDEMVDNYCYNTKPI